MDLLRHKGVFIDVLYKKLIENEFWVQNLHPNFLGTIIAEIQVKLEDALSDLFFFQKN